MGEQPKYNNYSDQLKGLIPQLKDNETVTFRASFANSFVNKRNDDESIVRQHVMPASQNVPNTDRILDPYTNEYIDIAYVTGQAPANRNGRGARVNLGTIEFTGARAGALTLTRKDQALVNYLCLTNYNKDSVNPEVSAPKNGFIFEQVKPAESATSARETNRKILLAKIAIEDAEKEELDILRETAGIPSVENNITLTAEEIKNRLDRIAEVKPQFIINATSDVAGKLRVLIRESEKKGIIEFNDEENEYRWADSKETITKVKPGGEPENSMLSYLQNNNKNADAAIKRLQAGVAKKK